MAMNYTDEEYHQISLEEYFEEDVKPNLFAVSRVFAEARKQMTLSEHKTLVYALSQIKWKEKCPDTLYLNKKEVAKEGTVTDVSQTSDEISVSKNIKMGI